MKNKIIVLTGGAGFIGSNLLAYLLEMDEVSEVRVIDDLSNGYYENLREFEGHGKFKFYEEDICDYDKMVMLTKDATIISHQAALGSVPRSIENPVRSDRVNVGGTVNMLHAAVVNKVERVVLACSSSTYGDSKALPKQEDKIGNPLSPYAVTKLAVEHYAKVFNRSYGLNFIGLRYFNVFGPKQNPDNPYAAVIPIFCKAFMENKVPTINGDGITSRDFTFVDNAVQANILSMFTTDNNALNEIYNVACGEQTSLNQMVNILNEITGKTIQPNYGPERPGDVKHSLADISKISSKLNYKPTVFFKEGLSKVYNWYLTQ